MTFRPVFSRWHYGTVLRQLIVAKDRIMHPVYELILRKIIKIVATRCQILRLKCTQFDFGWGSAPDPAGGAYSAPQTL